MLKCQLLEWELLSSGMVLRGWSARVSSHTSESSCLEFPLSLSFAGPMPLSFQRCGFQLPGKQPATVGENLSSSIRETREATPFTSSHRLLIGRIGRRLFSCCTKYLLTDI